jgi:hypothetical protein
MKLSSPKVDEIAKEWFCSHKLNRRGRSQLELVEQQLPADTQTKMTNAVRRAYLEVTTMIENGINELPMGTLVVLDETGAVVSGPPLVQEIEQHVLGPSDIRRLFPRLRMFWLAEDRVRQGMQR